MDVDMLTKDQKSSKGINALLPIEKILSSQKDQARFIKILSDDADGFMSRASRKFGCSVRTVQRRMSENLVFNESIKSIQEAYRQKRLDKLETISYKQAKQPGNFRERKFLMESLAPGKYRSTFRDSGPANIQINFGYTVPENRYGMNKPNPPETDEITLDAEFVDEKPADGIENVDLDKI